MTTWFANFLAALIHTLQVGLVHTLWFLLAIAVFVFIIACIAGAKQTAAEREIK